MTKNIFLYTIFQDLFAAEQRVMSLNRPDQALEALGYNDKDQIEQNLKAGNVDEKLIPIVLMHVDAIITVADQERDKRLRADLVNAKASVKRREVLIDNYIDVHYTSSEVI